MLLRYLELKQIGTDDLRWDAVAWETGKIEDPRKLIQKYAARKSKICRILRYQDGKTGKDRTLTRSRRSDLLIFALRIHPPETNNPQRHARPRASIAPKIPLKPTSGKRRTYALTPAR